MLKTKKLMPPSLIAAVCAIIMVLGSYVCPFAVSIADGPFSFMAVSQEIGNFGVAIMFLVFPALCLVFALFSKAIPLFIFTLLSSSLVGIFSYAMRGYDDFGGFSVGFYLFWAAAILSAICAVWLFVLKIKSKKDTAKE